MEEYSQMCNLKKQKIDEELERTVTCKSSNIGDLPDEVLQHMLSFLSTKDAFRTSVLAKRWEYLWTTIPELQFEEDPNADRKTFMDFVGRALVLHIPSKLIKFCLKCKVVGDAPRISSWVENAVKCQVEVLHLSLSHFKESTFELPSSLFSSQTLVDLALVLDDTLIKFPPSLSFSSLKSLTLRYVILPDQHLTEKLFCCSPNLEILHIIYCDWKRLKGQDVMITALKLVFLAIHESLLEDNNSNCYVYIFGLNLGGFYYSGALSNYYYLSDMSTLENVILDICHPPSESYYEDGDEDEDEDEDDDDDEDGDEDNEELFYRVRAYMLLKGISECKVTRLSLSTEAIEAFTYGEELSFDVPRFNNLKCISIVEGDFAFIDGREFFLMLQNCPNLVEMRFHTGMACEEKNGVLEPVPSCLLSKLKFVILEGFSGQEEQELAVKILLKNARVLEGMFMLVDNPDHIEGVIEQVTRIPKASTNCKVVVGLP